MSKFENPEQVKKAVLETFKNLEATISDTMLNHMNHGGEILFEDDDTGIALMIKVI